jgi:hypothetical protein
MRPILPFLLLLAGCASKPEPKALEEAPRPPKITHFYGNALTLPRGELLTLCYGTGGATSVSIEPSDDKDLKPSINRCIGHTPQVNTTYTLTAKGPGGTVTETFKVEVGRPYAKLPSGDRILITSFTLSENSRTPGEPVRLCYSTDGAIAVSLMPRVAVPLKPGASQCFVVRPEKKTTYVLTATADDGFIDRMQVTVAVQ